VLIATNQSGVARGYYNLDMLDRIHDKLMRELASVGGYIDEVFFCPHHPDEDCACRKPKPGLLHQIKNQYPINLEETFFIGDSVVDIHAAQAAGCLPVLVLTGRGEHTLADYPALVVPTFPNLAKAVEAILSNQIK
jgi:D-glycero-D-manno-heptose 1,7-bisphosphate phosphatase